MSRLEKYRKQRLGLPEEIESEDQGQSPTDLDLSKDRQKAARSTESAKVKSQAKADPKDSSRRSETPAAPLDLSKPKNHSSPMHSGSGPTYEPEPELSKAQKPKKPKKPTEPKLPSVVPSLFEYTGHVIATLAVGFMIVTIIVEMMQPSAPGKPQKAKPDAPSRVAEAPPTYQPPIHRTLDFFITDAGKLMSNTPVKNLKRINTVVGTQPIYLPKQVKSGKYTRTVIEKSHNPLKADFTYLLLESGERLPVDITMGWLKSPVTLYGAHHSRSNRRMVCLARPINRCAFLHDFR